jgi:hypothetical protein
MSITSARLYVLLRVHTTKAPYPSPTHTALLAGWTPPTKQKIHVQSMHSSFCKYDGAPVYASSCCVSQRTSVSARARSNTPWAARGTVAVPTPSAFSCRPCVGVFCARRPPCFLAPRRVRRPTLSSQAPALGACARTRVVLRLVTAEHTPPMRQAPVHALRPVSHMRDLLIAARPRVLCPCTLARSRD